MAQSGIAEVVGSRLMAIDMDDLRVAKIVGTALGARLGLVVTLNENSGIFRVLGESGIPEELPTLAALLMRLYAVVDGDAEALG
ncbi:MAG TPA: hypothetical protein VMV44_14490 [Rectinemataceae bacterium]|nr:hypothetical protein [Rectinemataceae bacterium]